LIRGRGFDNQEKFFRICRAESKQACAEAT
jgi:hypothetical protein